MHQRLIQITPWVVIVAGAVVALSWILYIPAVTHFGTFATSMKLMTAVLFIICGAQLYLFKTLLFNTASRSQYFEIGFWILSAATFIALVVVCVANASPQIAHLLGFIPDPYIREGWRWIPSVPAPMTLACFVLISTTNAVVLVWRVYEKMLLPWLAGFLIVVGVVAIFGNLASIPGLYYESKWAGGMAIHTAMLFVLIGAYFLALSNRKHIL